jgi:flagellar biosynthesis/type III secretory pathway protein FliH
MRSLLFIVAFLMLAANTVIAQVEQQPTAKDQQKTYLYQWIDDKGIAHVTDNLGNVPKKYRGKALMLEQAPTEKEPAQAQPQVTAPSRGDESANEEYAKAEWQQRMKDARVRLADAERRYQELDKKRLEALGKWGGVASGQLEGRQEAERIAEQMKQVRKEIDDARNQIDQVIPDEARKAGVPPGWLRE